LILDLERYRPHKVSAALCHLTQNALFVRAASKEAGRALNVEQVVEHVESIHRVYPIVQAGEPVKDSFAALLRASGLARENPAHLNPQQPIHATSGS
jgi:hypothetical protein